MTESFIRFLFKEKIFYIAIGLTIFLASLLIYDYYYETERYESIDNMNCAELKDFIKTASNGWDQYAIKRYDWILECKR